MRKKTTPRAQQHAPTSSADAKDQGLIAREENSSQSAGDECALDNRSHRTLSFRREPARAKPCGC
jgi:hypothetical protein